MSNVIVIGAGAAGMMAAITAAQQGHCVQLLEKNEKPGKKLFITGKGRCNVTNAADTEDMLKAVMRNPKFLYSGFYGFSNSQMMSFLEENGLPLKIERGNRVFPVSDHSSDVIKTLTKVMNKEGVKLCLNTEVDCLLLEDNPLTVTGVRLKSGEELKADSVIVATGGVSYVLTGSTGDGYEFAKMAGHNIVKPEPSLVPMVSDEEWVKSLQGLSLKNVTLSIYKGNKKIYEDMGEMLFTHFGISGPLVLSASAVCGTINKDNHVKAEIDLKPALNQEQLDARLLKDFEKYTNKQFRNALSDLLPTKMIPIIVELSGIDPYKQVNVITKQERTTLIDLLKHLPIDISGVRGFNEAIITRGGVDVKGVDPSTMASKYCNHLYFAGEVLDLDALTGGFNLQIAWSTGWLAGISVQ